MMSRVSGIAIAIRSYWRNHPLLLLFAVAAAVFFAWPPDQVTELYRIFIVQEVSAGAYFKVSFLALLVAVVLPCFAIWYNSLCIDCQRAEESREVTASSPTDRVLAAVFGLLPLIGLSLGVWDANTRGLEHVGAFLVIAAIGGLLFLALAELGRGLFFGRWSLPDRLFEGTAHRVVLLLLALACLPFFLTGREGVISDTYSAMLQPLFIAGLFIAFFCTLISQALRWKAFRLPIATVLLGLIIGTALVGTNAHHRVTPLQLSSEVMLRPALPPQVKERLDQGAQVASQIETPGPSVKSSFAFVRWVESREDRQQYIGRPYPAFVVVAEGGGLYAAYHTAMFLARMQDRCANFAQHLFALSGVSGGSLGGAVFSSLAKTLLTNEKHEAGCREPARGRERLFEDLTSLYFSEDLLSPLVGAAVFPDFFQLFLFNALPTT